MIISEMHHRITYVYINFQQNRVSIRSVKIVHTNLFKFATCNSNFEKSLTDMNHPYAIPIFMLILRSIGKADLSEPRPKVISTEDGRTDGRHDRRTDRHRE